MEVMMTMSTRNQRASYLATLAIAAISLAAMAIPLAPAKAQIGVQVGPFGFGIAPPPPAYTDLRRFLDTSVGSISVA
jgi:uncharacterized membrane protein YccC